MLLVLGSILFFSYLILTYQYLTNQNIYSGLENEAIVAEPSIEQTILEKIHVKAFDKHTVSSDVESPTQDKKTYFRLYKL